MCAFVLIILLHDFLGECPTLNNLANGATTLNSSFVGNNATFSCYSGYDIVGSPTSTCHSNGVWTPIPTCKRETISNSICIIMYTVHAQLYTTMSEDNPSVTDLLAFHF